MKSMTRWPGGRRTRTTRVSRLSLRTLPRRRNDAVRRVLLAGTGAAAATLAGYLDKRRRRDARERAAAAVRGGTEAAQRKAEYAAGVAGGVARAATAPLRPADREYDDATLQRKVESELFRPADAPKGSVNVNVQHGVVELRGEVERPEQIQELGRAAERIAGVKEVHNLLHTPGSPPKHSPPSDPEDVRRRAKEPRPSSNFSGNPATTPPADGPFVGRAPSSRPRPS